MKDSLTDMQFDWVAKVDQGLRPYVQEMFQSHKLPSHIYLIQISAFFQGAEK